MRCVVLAALAVGVGAVVGVGSAQGTVIHNEVVNGDLSNDKAAPTHYALLPGVSSILASVNGATDFQDWVSITVPAGYELSALVLTDYDSQDAVAFTGFQFGPAFVGSEFEAGSYAGWTHLGPTQLGEDLLLHMADQVTNPGSQGFTPPLPAGTYTFLIQQIGDDTLYLYDFHVTAVPGPAGLLALAGVGALARRRR
jgi:hypothetical protein